jgi:hypothetical protein
MSGQSIRFKRWHLPQEKKVCQLALEGLLTDGDSHKQWYLEEILRIYGEDDIAEDDMYKERGVAP